MLEIIVNSMHQNPIRNTIGALVAMLVFAATIAVGQEPDLGAVGKHQALLDLGTDLRLMCVAAHPDDEDGATLAMYRKRYGYKTFALLATRGEGGQNEIGPELYEELAVLRTHEMARAAAITGAELHFLDLPEFGYSKSREETFEIWGYENALERMVRKIRELRPDVIITNHGPTGGHGHHQAIGKVVQDAFDAAADPDAFPEHLEQGLKPWQPARLFLRSFGGDAEYRIDFSRLDPVRGLTYAQIAANALREHETQGMGFFIDRFLTSRSSTSYRLIKEHAGGIANPSNVAAPGGVLFEGLKGRVSAEARKLTQRGLPSVTLDAALSHLKQARGKGDAGSIGRANRLVRRLAELRLTADVSDEEVVPGQKVSLAVEAIDYGNREARDIMFSLRAASWFPAGIPKAVNESFSSDGFATARLEFTVPKSQPRTIPPDEFVFSAHFLKPQLTVVATVDVNGTPVTLEAPVRVDVAPPVSIDFVDAPYLVRQGVDKSVELAMLVTNHTPGPNAVTVDAAAASGLSLNNGTYRVEFKSEGEQKVVPVRANVARGIRTGDYALTAKVVETGYAQTSLARVVNVEVPKDKRVGVVASYDDTFVTTLERLGVPHATLDVADFVPERLDEFSTIIVDIRAYLVRPDLVANNQALLDYVKRGGNMIVMYQKTFEWDESYAPYPLTVSRNRVTVEEAPIQLLEPDHALFNTPNKIVAEDWDGWIQERGLYFPSRWADEYIPLIDVRDPGESPPPGSTLIAQYGEGTYMYTALGWYRQLRELHPGTLRIFANMLAL